MSMLTDHFNNKYILSIFDRASLQTDGKTEKTCPRKKSVRQKRADLLRAKPLYHYAMYAFGKLGV